ncbi:hypothetical protein [Aphanothece sacrum]|uniref:Uncharacterized protein n=1 Tax=Aphanothece sacrum FPU1 TaxID=1920663 RepID=A0A401IG51_APHSA|nr:hypothetical protein [Aphanothece sacrum]GBF80191.1 hypothetical protein AsFPU1_1592 [Aphanothece sacrum FPU1]GBF85344.1 hypothetical protein AsFPU3_2403 [Aphanothece sacrum FPU3]
MILSTNLFIDNINSIDPSYVYTYLENNGWKEESKLDDIAVILTTNKNNKKYSLLLPLDQEIPDFYSRMYDVLRTLEVVDNKSKEEIIKDFKSPHQVALEQQTEIISLRFQFIYDEYKKQFSAKKMGLVLVSLQNLFDAFGELESGQESESIRGRISPKVLDKTEISVFETFKGSFGVKLAFAKLTQQLDLFEERPLAERVSHNFLELINLSNSSDKENLKQMLLHLKKRIASRYRKFLAELIRDQSNFYIDWGSVNPEAGGHAYLTYENTVNTIDFINKMETENPEEITVRGKLLLASKSKRNYLEILSLEDKQIYTGDILDQVLKNTNIELTIDRLYIVTFEEITLINPATGEEKIERKVINIKYMN